MFSNLMYFLFATVPILIYGFILYLQTPHKLIKIRKAILFLFAGMGSVMLVFFFQFIFPNFQNSSNLSAGDFGGWLLFWIVNVSLVEETSKYLTWKGLQYLLLKKEDSITKRIPIVTLFYYVAVAGGFALFENFFYAQNASNAETLGVVERGYTLTVLGIRSITAVLGHLSWGVIFGWFIAMGENNHLDLNTSKKSVINVWMKTKPRAKRIIFTLVGGLVVVLLHGIYDSFAQKFGADSPYFWGLLISQIVLAFLAIRHILRLSFKDSNS